MATRNRATFKKREREMAKKQKRQDKAQRIADRKANRTAEAYPEEVQPAPVDDADKPSTMRITTSVDTYGKLSGSEAGIGRLGLNKGDSTWKGR